MPPKPAAAGGSPPPAGAAEELRYAGGLDLSELSAIKRERPDSATDYSFRVVSAGGAVRVDPGSKEAYELWQEGLMAAVSSRPSAKGRG